VLRESVQRKLAGALRIPEVEAGVHTVGWLGDGLNALKVARTVVAHKVEVTPLNAFTLKSAGPRDCYWDSGQWMTAKYVVGWTCRPLPLKNLLQ
jgi:hypothetical protein